MNTATNYMIKNYLPLINQYICKKIKQELSDDSFGM